MIVTTLIETLASANKENSNSKIIQIIKEGKLAEKIAKHKEIKEATKLYNQSQNNSNREISIINEYLKIFSCSDEVKISEKICADIMSDLKVGKSLHVMPYFQFEEDQTLAIPIRDFYTDIKFTETEVIITYSDDIIRYNLKELLQQPMKNFMDKHHVLTMPLNEHLYLDFCTVRN